jgi:hypothetical protein
VTEKDAKEGPQKRDGDLNSMKAKEIQLLKPNLLLTEPSDAQLEHDGCSNIARDARSIQRESVRCLWLFLDSSRVQPRWEGLHYTLKGTQLAHLPRNDGRKPGEAKGIKFNSGT